MDVLDGECRADGWLDLQTGLGMANPTHGVMVLHQHKLKQDFLWLSPEGDALTPGRP